MDLDEMLRVDRCRDMDELINFDPDLDHSLDARTCLLSSISYALQRGIYYIWKIPCISIGRPSLQRAVVLKRFYSP